MALTERDTVGKPGKPLVGEYKYFIAGVVLCSGCMESKGYNLYIETWIRLQIPTFIIFHISP